MKSECYLYEMETEINFFINRRTNRNFLDGHLDIMIVDDAFDRMNYHMWKISRDLEMVYNLLLANFDNISKMLRQPN